MSFRTCLEDGNSNMPFVRSSGWPFRLLPLPGGPIRGCRHETRPRGGRDYKPSDRPTRAYARPAAPSAGAPRYVAALPSRHRRSRPATAATARAGHARGHMPISAPRCRPVRNAARNAAWQPNATALRQGRAQPASTVIWSQTLWQTLRQTLRRTGASLADRWSRRRLRWRLETKESASCYLMGLVRSMFVPGAGG